MLRGAVLLLLLLVQACGDGQSAAERAARQREDQVREVARAAGLSEDVGDFLATAAGAGGERFMVSYALPDETGGTATLTQDPPRRRVDIRAVEGGEELTRSLIVTGEGSFTCLLRRGAWTCARATGETEELTPFGEDDLDRSLAQLEASRESYDYRIGEREVAGVDATCLVTELKSGKQPSAELGQKGTLCISAEGTPLLVETPSSSLRAQRYSTDIDDDAFTLPATPADG